MQKTAAQLLEIKILGITCRTNNVAEKIADTAKIGPLVQKYMQSGVAERIPHRKNPGTTYSIFTQYESDFRGEYTYVIGEEVTSFGEVPEGFFAMTIPAQSYEKFTNGPGPMPEVCISAWQKIWNLTPEELGGTRGYLADFELYDKRAQDPNNVILDIYIGLKK